MRDAEMGSVDQRIAAIKGDDRMTAGQRLLRSIQLQWWPFVLVFALGIKFGKAMVGWSGIIALVGGWGKTASAYFGGLLSRIASRRRQKKSEAPPNDP